MRRKSLILLIPTLIALVYIYFMSGFALNTRIENVGAENFPASILDWFAIVGTGILTVLFILGVLSIIRILKIELMHRANKL